MQTVMWGNEAGVYNKGKWILSIVLRTAGFEFVLKAEPGLLYKVAFVLISRVSETWKGLD